MNARGMGTVLRLLGIGWYVTICIGGGAFGGLWLDRQLDRGPLFTLLGLGVGLGLTIMGMYRMILGVLAIPPDSEAKR